MKTKHISKYLSCLMFALSVVYMMVPLSADASYSNASERNQTTPKALRSNFDDSMMEQEGDVSSRSLSSVGGISGVKSKISDISDYPIVVVPTYNNYLIPYSDNAPFWALLSTGSHGMAGTPANTYFYSEDDYFMGGSQYELYWDVYTDSGVDYVVLGVIPTSTYPINSFSSILSVAYGDVFVYSYSPLIPNINNCSQANQCAVANDIAPHNINSVSSETSPDGNISVQHDNSSINQVSGYYETAMVPVYGGMDYALTNVETADTPDYEFNAEAGPFYNDASGSLIQEIKGGPWLAFSCWIDTRNKANASDTSGLGYSLSGDGRSVATVLMSASGDYSGVWGDEITITGNGFGDIGESVRNAGRIEIDGTSVEVTNWTENSVSMRIPMGDTDASNQTGGVPVTIYRSDGIEREINVTFDNTDDSAVGTEQTSSLNAANVPNDNGHVVAMNFGASSDDPSTEHNEEVMEYRVYRFEGNGPDHGSLPIGDPRFIMLTTITATEAADYSYTDRNVPQNRVNYTYYVTSVDKNGNEQVEITSGNRSVTQALDEIIDELELTLDPGDETLGVSWSHDNEGGDVAYTICYAEDSDLLQGDYTELAGRDGVACVTTTDASVVFGDLVNGNRYYVRGYANDGEGNVSVTGIYYADLLANLPESSIVGEVIGNMPGSVRIFAGMILLALVVSFANMMLIKNKVQKVLFRS
jgi:hypothetical protein